MESYEWLLETPVYHPNFKDGKLCTCYYEKWSPALNSIKYGIPGLIDLFSIPIT